MNNSGASVRPLAIALALTAGAVVTADLSAQEAECRLVSNAQTEGAVEKLTTAGETEDPEAQRALFTEALESLQSEIQDDDDPTALWLAAEAQIGLGDFEAADALLVRFVAANPACKERSDNSRFNGWATAYIPPGHYRVDQSPSMQPYQSPPGRWFRCSDFPCAPTSPGNILGTGAALRDVPTFVDILPSDVAVALHNVTLTPA